MPSPFTRRPANTSTDTAVDRRPMVPEVEFYAGTNLPYRGVMYHGVEPTEEASRPEPYDTGAVEVYEEQPPEQIPVPVRVVNQVDRFDRTARADTFTIGTTDQPINIAGRDDTRIKLTVFNADEAEAVYLGFSPSMTRWNGAYLLAAGRDHALVTSEPVYVMGTAATVVSWIAEFEVPIDDD